MRSGPVLVAAAILVAAGCGSEAPAPPAATSSAAPATTITVTVQGGKVRTPSRRVTVRRGRTVEIVVTSDAADEFHLHGYDREIELRPGVPGVLRFVADQPGVFEAELHKSGAHAFDLRVN
jgi:heme/copper-type cytochrome/quinol oxidase subunit 2